MSLVFAIEFLTYLSYFSCYNNFPPRVAVSYISKDYPGLHDDVLRPATKGEVM